MLVETRDFEIEELSVGSNHDEPNIYHLGLRRQREAKDLEDEVIEINPLQ